MQQIQETFPDWRDKFLSYKDLKKLVRLISSVRPTLLDGSLDYGRFEREFVYLLRNEIEKFNVFFMEQEEDFIIRHKVSFSICSRKGGVSFYIYVCVLIRLGGVVF